MFYTSVKNRLGIMSFLPFFLSLMLLVCSNQVDKGHGDVDNAVNNNDVNDDVNDDVNSDVDSEEEKDKIIQYGLPFLITGQSPQGVWVFTNNLWIDYLISRGASESEIEPLRSDPRSIYTWEFSADSNKTISTFIDGLHDTKITMQTKIIQTNVDVRGDLYDVLELEIMEASGYEAPGYAVGSTREAYLRIDGDKLKGNLGPPRRFLGKSITHQDNIGHVFRKE